MEGKRYEKGILENRKAGGVFNMFRSLLGASLEPPRDWVLGVDVSHWNGFSDFALMKSRGIKWGIFKGSDIGSDSKKGFVDDKAKYNYTEMGESGILRGAYHWLDPRYGTPEYQAEFYLENVYFKYPTELPAVMDFEDNAVISWNDMLWRGQKWLEIVELETKRTPIVYTSNGFIANFVKSNAGWLSKYPLWIAHYIQRNYPTVPSPWKNALMWQYSDKGDYPYYEWNSPKKYGREWGSGSSYLDMNWFMGTHKELLEFCEGTEVTPPEPTKPLFKAFCKAYTLYKRSGPSTSFPTVGHLKKRDIVDVYEVENGWYRIDPVKQVWCSGKWMTKMGHHIHFPIIRMR